MKWLNTTGLLTVISATLLSAPQQFFRLQAIQ
jgi:hypothetical protein